MHSIVCLFVCLFVCLYLNWPFALNFKWAAQFAHVIGHCNSNLKGFHACRWTWASTMQSYQKFIPIDTVWPCMCKLLSLPDPSYQNHSRDLVFSVAFLVKCGMESYCTYESMEPCTWGSNGSGYNCMFDQLLYKLVRKYVSIPNTFIRILQAILIKGLLLQNTGHRCLISY